MSYIGRFAPSPTGPLHFGSLIAALASFLDAKSQNGLWLMRMEDLDPPREPEGAAQQILQQLSDLQLDWDGDVLYQSTRVESYERALATISEQDLSFPCTCTRPDIREMGAVYNGRCRDKKEYVDGETAIRVRTRSESISFSDRIFGDINQNVEREVGDFVVKRKDGLFAYQLAVVVDDAFQDITHIVRGYDLLDSTPRQIYLQHLLDLPTPKYCHIPIVVDDQGQKLSKQQFAEPIDSSNGNTLIFQALQLLGQNPENSLRNESIANLLHWATEHWDIQAIPKLANMPLQP